MRKCTARKIIKAVPNIQSVVLPKQWFDNLDGNRSVFVSLYDWMLKNDRIPSINKESLHNRTYVGEKLYKRLVAAEKKRLRKNLKIKGEELERAVIWSDIDSGPKTEIGSCKISGDAILVIPEASMQSLAEFSSKIYNEKRDNEIKKIRAHAAGATFYQWLLPQVERPDRIGDLSRDVVSDDLFPRNSAHYEDIKTYLLSQGACTAAIESLKDGWVEYLHQYPERIQPYGWCSECGERFDVKETYLALNSESQEAFILDQDCLNRFNEFEEMASYPLADITNNDIKNLSEKYEVSDFVTKDVIERLVLWGIKQANEAVSDQTVSSKYVRRSISNSKRYAVLRRDKFQCVLCGASGSEANL